MADDGTLPLLAHFFHIMPWDIPRLTMDELNGFIAAVPRKMG